MERTVLAISQRDSNSQPPDRKAGTLTAITTGAISLELFAYRSSILLLEVDPVDPHAVLAAGGVVILEQEVHVQNVVA